MAQWAAEQAQARSQALRQAREAAAAAADRRKQLADAFSETERALARLRAGAKTASEDDQRARVELSQVTARIAELDELLKDAPDDAQISAQLTLRDQLEAAAALAEAELRAARAARTKSEAAVTALERDEQEARGQLSAARDRVVALGAPALDLKGLLD